MQRQDTERINAAGAAELAGKGMMVNTADTDSFRTWLGEFYKRWRDNVGPAAWQLLETYAGELPA